MNPRQLSSAKALHLPAQAAAEWLVLLTDEACTDGDRMEFLAWLRASTLHVEEFLRLSALDRRLHRRELWPDDSRESLKRRATEASIEYLSDAAPPVASWRPTTTRVRFALVASIAVLVAICGSILMWRGFDMFDLDSQRYATPLGEQRSITLSDGSVIELNSRSELNAHYTSHERRVQLIRGEAVFKVAKNRARPFRVTVGTTEVVAVGTAFNIDAREAQTVVTVIEGRVRVSDSTTNRARTPSMELGRDEQVIITRDRSVSPVRHADPIKVLAWTQQRLIFDDTPLAEVATEFARYHQRMIYLEDDALRQRRITGVFDSDDPSSLIEFLRADGSVHVETEKDGWKLSTTDLKFGTAAAEGRR